MKYLTRYLALLIIAFYTTSVTASSINPSSTMNPLHQAWHSTTLTGAAAVSVKRVFYTGQDIAGSNAATGPNVSR